MLKKSIKISEFFMEPIPYDKRSGKIWFNGKPINWSDVKIHVLSHGLHYASCVFEGERVYDGEIFKLQEHTDRLFHSAERMGFEIPYSRETINESCKAIVKLQKVKNGYVRPVAWRGSEMMAISAQQTKIHVAIAAWEWGAYLGAESLEHGIRVRTSSYTRHHVNITMCKAKAIGNYTNSIMALQEALTCGYDEALLLDNEGYVQEGSGENLFLVRNGALYTPDLTSALDGITRDTLQILAAELDIPVYEKRITRDEVYIADEAFFTGTAAEVTPIREADNRTIGNGNRGPITEQLQTLYFEQVHGRRDQNKQWLTPVYSQED